MADDKWTYDSVAGQYSRANLIVRYQSIGTVKKCWRLERSSKHVEFFESELDAMTVGSALVHEPNKWGTVSATLAQMKELSAEIRTLDDLARSLPYADSDIRGTVAAAAKLLRAADDDLYDYLIAEARKIRADHGGW